MQGHCVLTLAYQVYQARVKTLCNKYLFVFVYVHFMDKKTKKKKEVKQNPELIRFSKAQQEQTDTLT